MGPAFWRYLAVCTLCACVMHMNTCRMSMPIVLVSLAEQNHWTLPQQSQVLSSFYLGYMPSQFIGGLLATWFGAARVVGCALMWWSVFTSLTPLAANMGFEQLIACRILMGVGQGVTLPAAMHFLASLIPLGERARSVALVTSGAQMGVIAAFAITPLVIEQSSPTFALNVYSACGVVLVLVWGAVASLLPPPHPPSKTYEIEMGSIRSSLDAPPPPATLVDIGRNKAAWGLALCAFFYDWSNFTVMNFLPSYYRDALGLDVEQLSITFLPYLSMAVCGVAGGALADRLLKNNVDLTSVRKLLTVGPMVLAAVICQLVAHSSSPITATICLCFALGASAFVSGGFMSNYLDIVHPVAVGSLKGFCNTIASFSGVVALPFTAWLLGAFHSWEMVFSEIGVSYLIGAFIFWSLGTAERVL